MAITTLFAAFVSPLYPPVLYHIREFLGKLELAQNRGNRRERNLLNNLACCFQPIENLSVIKIHYTTDLKPTVKRKPSVENNITKEEIKKLQKSFEKLAEAQIKFLQTTPSLFNNCMRVIPKDQAYESDALGLVKTS